MNTACSPTSSRIRISAAPSFKARCAASVALLALLSACGKKGPPLPPIRIEPAPPGVLKVRQIGQEVVLTGTLSGTRTDGSLLGSGTEVRVLRMTATETLRPGSVSERYMTQQFTKQARSVATIKGEQLAKELAARRIVYHDGEIEASSGATMLYALQVFEADGRRSPMRLPVAIELVSPPPAPSGLRVEVAEGEVRLSWAPGAESAHGPYNIYRREVGAMGDPDAPLNPAPIEEAAYVDRTFQYGVAYAYFVRAVGEVRTTRCESVSSPSAEVRPLDTFPPATPSGLAVAVEGGVIRLYWFPNAEQDLNGYRIYRRAEGEKEPVLVGTVSAAETAFVDPSAAPGVRYHYSVSAIDGADPLNESPRSEEHSEMLSKDPTRGRPTEPQPGVH